MGACICRDELNGDDDDFLLVPVPAIREAKGVPSSICSPFRLRVRCGSTKDLEGQALRALLDLACSRDKRPSSTAGNAKPVVAGNCISLLLALQAEHREALLDLIVPVTTVMLHADEAIRSELWEFFVNVSVQRDNLLGHLFYWAIRSVAKCPQAAVTTKKEASRLLELVAAALHRHKGKVASNGTSVSPLVDLFDELHVIGDVLVNEPEKAARQKLLEQRLEQVNSSLPSETRVPLSLMVPCKEKRRPGCMPGSLLLHVPSREGGVLSSKARAPYHVLIEAETLPLKAKSGLRSRFGGCCSRRASSNFTANAEESGKSTSSPQASTSKRCSGSSQGAKGLFKDETWDEVQVRLRKSSKNGALPNWNLISLIVKSSADDVRQEEMAYRLIKWFQRVFTRHDLRKLWLRPFLILATTHDAGVLEAVPNAISLDALKKSYGSRWKSLKGYFEQTFPVNGENGHKGASFQEAIANFVESMAAYSVVCYVLAIRDRHNGNIMLDDVGHIVHVDFGFMLCGSPGGKAAQQMGGFEHTGGFKLTAELMEVLDCQADLYKLFKELLVKGLTAVRHEAQELLSLLQLSLIGSENSSMMCFESPRGHPEDVLEDVCDRLCLPRKGGRAEDVRTDEEFCIFAERLVDQSVGHWRTRLYDTVQYMQNGIL